MHKSWADDSSDEENGLGQPIPSGTIETPKKNESSSSKHKSWADDDSSDDEINSMKPIHTEKLEAPKKKNSSIPKRSSWADDDSSDEEFFMAQQLQLAKNEKQKKKKNSKPKNTKTQELKIEISKEEKAEILGLISSSDDEKEVQSSQTKTEPKSTKASENGKKTKPKKDKKSSAKTPKKDDLESIFSEFGVEIDENQIQKENEIKQTKGASKTPRNNKKDGGKTLVPVTKFTGGGVTIKKKVSSTNKPNEPEAVTIAAMEEILNVDKKKKKKDKTKYNQAPTR